MEIFAIIDCQEKSTAEMLCVKKEEKGNNVFVSKGFGLYGAVKAMRYDDIFAESRRYHRVASSCETAASA